MLAKDMTQPQLKQAVRDLILAKLDEVLVSDIDTFPCGNDTPDAIHGVANDVLDKVGFNIEDEGTALATA